ncbi:MAG TPA: winged helix-turn-helix domain-containing protein, partial [Desulfobaccales bacterium]|nr:winged helix-turn-helix domain-containing protein [Desulfobaccales bacterium]
AVTERAVDVQIVGLRKKLGPAGQDIETVRGVGYRLKE